MFVGCLFKSGMCMIYLSSTYSVIYTVQLYMYIMYDMTHLNLYIPESYISTISVHIYKSLHQDPMHPIPRAKMARKLTVGEHRRIENSDPKKTPKEGKASHLLALKIGRRRRQLWISTNGRGFPWFSRFTPLVGGFL